MDGNSEAQMRDEQDDAVEVVYWWVLLPSGELSSSPPGPEWHPVKIERDENSVKVSCARWQIAEFLEGKI